MTKYCICGMGRSGQSALEILYNKKDLFYLFDEDETKLRDIFQSNKKYQNIFIINNITKELLIDFDKIILSPSFSINDKRFILFKDKIISELELGYKNNKNKLIAITGTNGKTTTTSLISHILSCAKINNIACGNIGLPLSSVSKNNIVKVCEVSSFQLEATHKFCPNIACLLNVTPDHLDRHKSMRNYTKIKYKIFENMQKNSYAIINSNLPIPKNIKSKVYTFGKKANNACYISGECYVFCKNNKEQIVCKTSVSSLVGLFNQENIMCAIIVAKLMGVKNDIISKSLATYKACEHRMKCVYRSKKISVYDDSKATNIDACLRAIQSFQSRQNICLILGGSDKNTDFDLLIKKLPQNVSKIIAVGGVRKKIISSIKRTKCHIKYLSFPTLNIATRYALMSLRSGVLLLSPACASFDEFSSYAERGEKFIKYVNSYFLEKQ